MYERNAIVLDRYFNKMFGYDMKNNLKTNFKDYCELVEALEKYKNISEEEETVIQEYDLIANKIREIQKKQETLDKKNNSYQQERTKIFQNIEDDANTIQKKVNSINTKIRDINAEIEENTKGYIDVVNEFNEKSEIRTSCGKKRRIIEEKYNKKLNETLDNYKNIDVDFAKKAKQFIDADTENIEEELSEEIESNGEKEKIPFNKDILIKAISLSIDIQKRETDILANVYDKTNKLFADIKNNSTKIDKYEKIIRDAKSKLEFIGALKEYLIQLLDNERLTAVNGEKEHKKLMEEACKNVEEDMIQINNLYTLLLKEMSNKITKKSYSELYNLEYIELLEKKSQEFDAKIKELNLPVTIINPNYWRIEGMKGIYDAFYDCVTENYERDLSIYTQEREEESQNNEEKNKQENEYLKKESKKPSEGKIDEIDEKIDIILGIKDSEEEDTIDDDWDEDFEEYDDDDEYDADEDFEDDDDDEYDANEDFEDDFDEEDEDSEDKIEEALEEDFDDEEDDEYDEDFQDDEDNEDENDEYDDDDDGDWEDEFINIDRKSKDKKRKGFFDKFKK